MKPKVVREKININRIVEIIDDFTGYKLDYIQDSEGNNIFPVNPLEYKIINHVITNFNTLNNLKNEINLLKNRIFDLEKKK